MKFTRLILSCLVIVTAEKIEKQSFTPYVYLSGTVLSPSQMTENEAVSVGVNANTKTVVVLAGQNSVGKIKLGQSAQISGSGLEEKGYTATVISISDTAKKVTVGAAKVVVVEVVLKVENPDNDLKSGFSAKAKIFTDKPSDILSVPYSAVFSENGREYVYLLENSKSVKKEIKTYRELENGYEVVFGIKEGDVVITSPKNINKSGDSVTAREEN